MRNRGYGPQRGPGAEPQWGQSPSGVGGKAPRNYVWTLCNIHNSQQAKTSIQRHIQHDKNTTNLAQEIKLVWSSQSKLVNDFDSVVCACTWISANDVSHSSLIDDRRYVFSRLREEKERSALAVVTGNVTSTCSRMDRFGYRDALHAVYASSAVLGGSAAACQRCFHN